MTESLARTLRHMQQLLHGLILVHRSHDSRRDIRRGIRSTGDMVPQ